MASFRILRSILLLGTVTLVYILEGCFGNPDNAVLISGNVSLAAIFPVNDGIGANGSCGQYLTSSIQNLQAVKWFVDELNRNDYVPGVTIGLEVYRSCRNPEKAVQSTVSLLQKYDGDGGNPGQSSSLFGILGPPSTAEAMAVSRFIGSLPADQEVFQISGSATGAALSNKRLYPNFFRVIPSDSTQIQVMLQVMEQLEWNYVALVFDDDDYGRSAAKELRRLAEEKDICLPILASMPLDKSTSWFARNVSAIIEEVKRKHVRGMVIIGGHGTTQELIRRMNAEVRFVEFILSEATGLQRSTMESSSGSALGLAQGALLASPQYFGVPKFRTYWNSLWETKTVFVEQATENPWLAGFFKQKTGCTTDIGACWDGAQRDDLKLSTVDSSGEGLGLFTWYNVKATAVMAQFLKQLHEEKCAGTTGPCTRLTEAIKKRGDLLASLRGASFSLNDLGSSVSSFSDMTVQFDANGNITIPQGEAEYAVYNFRKETGGNNFVFKKIGAFDDGALNIQTPEAEFYSEDGSSLNWEALPKAQCPADRDCVECRKDLTDHVVFKEGDFYVVALIPVYSKNPTNSLECGDINGYSGADLVQAIMFAVDQVKTNVDFKGVLTGRTVGLVVINTCGTPLLVRQRILDLHSGRLTLPDGRNTSFIVPKIMGYVGAFYSSNSIAASETLTSIGRSYVEVSAVSTSPALSDRVKHPYFMRLVPPDDTQAQVFLDVVRSLGSNYIQIIYDASTAYATGLFNEVMKRVSRYDICVAQGIPITPRETSSEYKWIVDTLRDKSHAKLVIVILHELEVEKTMDAILPLLTDDNFVFLGCESWGRRQQLITGRTKLEGSLVLSLEIAVDQVFKNEFSQIDPRGGNNIWLNYFWEKRKNCYFEKSFERKDRQPCEDDIAHDYMQDTWAPFFINCVYSVVLGFNKTLSKHCSASPTFRSKCDALTSERLVEATKEVQLDLYSTGRKDKVFDSNGDGLGGFKVLQIVKDLSSSDSGQMLYKDVGTWTSDGLNLKSELLRFAGGSEFKSVCPNEVECNKCVTESSPTNTSTSTSTSSDGVPLPVTIGVSVALGVIVIALVVTVVVLVCLRRRTVKDPLWLMDLDSHPRRTLQSPPGDPTRQNDYTNDTTAKSLNRGMSNRSLPLPGDMSDRSLPLGMSSSRSQLPIIVPDEPQPQGAQSMSYKDLRQKEESRVSLENPYDLPTERLSAAHTYFTHT